MASHLSLIRYTDQAENLPKILYVCDGVSPWVVGGMQSVSRRHIGWLRELGYDVFVVTSRSKPNESSDLAERLVYLEWPRTAAWRKLDPRNYARQLIKFSERVNHIIDEYDPDLVYSEGPLVSAYLKRPRRTRVPTVFHPHGLEMYQSTGSLVTDLRLRPLRALVHEHVVNADITLSQGGRLDDILKQRIGVDGGKVAHLPNCTPAQFRFAQYPRKRQQGRFLFVGRDEVRKGLRRLIRAIMDVDSAQLEIVGGGQNLSQLSSRFTTHGVVSDRARLREIYDQVDFLVVPSLAEGMPTVILEAFAAGLPVIASDVGAIAGLVQNGENGFLVPRANIRALRQALTQAIDLPEQDYQTLSSSALNTATKEYSPEFVRSKLDGILRELIFVPGASAESERRL